MQQWQQEAWWLLLHGLVQLLGQWGSPGKPYLTTRSQLLRKILPTRGSESLKPSFKILMLSDFGLMSLSWWSTYLACWKASDIVCPLLALNLHRTLQALSLYRRGHDCLLDAFLLSPAVIRKKHLFSSYHAAIFRRQACLQALLWCMIWNLNVSAGSVMRACLLCRVIRTTSGKYCYGVAFTLQLASLHCGLSFLGLQLARDLPPSCCSMYQVSCCKYTLLCTSLYSCFLPSIQSSKRLRSVSKVMRLI